MQEVFVNTVTAAINRCKDPATYDDCSNKNAEARLIGYTLLRSDLYGIKKAQSIGQQYSLAVCTKTLLTELGGNATDDIEHNLTELQKLLEGPVPAGKLIYVRTYYRTVLLMNAVMTPQLILADPDYEIFMPAGDATSETGRWLDNKTASSHVLAIMNGLKDRMEVE